MAHGSLFLLAAYLAIRVQEAMVGQSLLVEESGTLRSVTWDWGPGGHRVLARTVRQMTDDEVDERVYAIVTDLVGRPTELVTRRAGLRGTAKPTSGGKGDYMIVFQEA